MRDPIPSAVRGYAAQVAGCSSDRVTAVTQFDRGNRHAVYRVSYLDATGPRNLVVRVANDGGAAECAQAEQEASAIRTVGRPAAPELYDFRCDGSWFETPVMCMEFVSGHEQDLRSATPEQLSRLGSIVAWVHERAADSAVDIAAYAEERLQAIDSKLAWVRDPLPDDVQARLRGAAASLKRWSSAMPQSFGTGEVLALLHGDIGPGNILWGPDPVLIDWEYARLGDPADEIAYLFDQNGLATSQRESFWLGYADRSRSVSQRVEWWEPVTVLGSALWWVERWVRRAVADANAQIDPGAARPPAYYSDHVLRRLDRFDDLIVSGRGDPGAGPAQPWRRRARRPRRA